MFDHLMEMAESLKSQVIIFQWVEYIKDTISSLKESQQSLANSNSNSASSNQLDNEEKDQESHSVSSMLSMDDINLNELDDSNNLNSTNYTNYTNYNNSSNKSNNNTTTNSNDLKWKDECPPITSGKPFTERKSVFVAHVAPVTTEDQVRICLFVYFMPTISNIFYMNIYMNCSLLSY